MRRHLVTAALLWIVLAAIGEALVWTDMFPTVGSKEAEDFDRIFRTLMVLGIPVFTFVIAVLAYSLLEFRSKDPSETGPVYRGDGAIPKVWIAVTGALALGVMIYPGLTGLAELQKGSKSNYGWGDPNAQLVVNVTGFRWSWNFEYADTHIKLLNGQTEELILPVDTPVKFQVHSSDVIHSFWIPAFRMKIDAVPGRTTYMTVTPRELGEFKDDDAYRVQCAELCGESHTTMSFPVKVVSQQEFQSWLVSQQKPKGQ